MHRVAVTICVRDCQTFIVDVAEEGEAGQEAAREIVRAAIEESGGTLTDVQDALSGREDVEDEGGWGDTQIISAEPYTFGTDPDAPDEGGEETDRADRPALLIAK